MSEGTQLLYAPVCRAEPADVPDVATLHAASLNSTWPEDEWHRMLTPPRGSSSDNALLLVSRCINSDASRGCLAGFLLARRVIDEAEIVAVAVLPSCRRQGVGQRLLGHLIEQLSCDLPCRLLLEVSVENIPALTLYRNNGFAEVGLRKAYYAMPGRRPVDAKLLARDLAN